MRKKRKVMTWEVKAMNKDYHEEKLTMLQIGKKYNRSISVVCQYVDNARSVSEGMILSHQNRRLKGKPYAKHGRRRRASAATLDVEGRSQQ